MHVIDNNAFLSDRSHFAIGSTDPFLPSMSLTVSPPFLDESLFQPFLDLVLEQRLLIPFFFSMG